MSSNPCPACRSPNRPTARHCEACGTALHEFDTVPSALTLLGGPLEAVDTPVGALWFDELAPAAGRPRPVPAASAAGIAALPGLTVRELHPDHPDAGPLPADRAARTAIKVARRAAVRRDRQAAAPPLKSVSDVLVMDADATARNQLDGLLGDFGFRVRPVATLAQAALLAGFHPFAAVFVAVPPGAIDGAVHDLFERVRQACRQEGVAPAARVLLATQWSPVDRVRAELAGCEATLARPVSRRDLARVLDVNGVVLPRDPRRA